MPDSSTKGTKGENLASFLSEQIEEMVTDERSRADIVQEVADAAGLTPSTINQILNGGIQCPTQDPVDAFASVVTGASRQQIVERMRQDGCEGEIEETAPPSERSVSMNSKVREFLLQQKWIAEDTSDSDAEKILAGKLADGSLSGQKYAKLLKSDGDRKSDLASMLDGSSQKTVDGIKEALGEPLSQLAKALVEQKSGGETTESTETTTATTDPDQPDDPVNKKLAELQQQVENLTKAKGGDGASAGYPDAYKVLSMGAGEAESDPVQVRVKSALERFDHTPTGVYYRSRLAKKMGWEGRPMKHNGRDLNYLTPRRDAMCAVWAKFQTAPHTIRKDYERDILHHILHREKFFVPNSRNEKEPRRLTEQERHDVWEHNTRGQGSKALIDDSGSGGEEAIPEFFDTDMIITPVLSEEDIPSFCNIIDVPRGTAAQNFVMGNLSIAAANTEGSAVSLFSTSGFLSAHDTSFFRAAGFIELGINFLQDAVPGLLDEIRMEYARQVRVWLNEQIMAGDGTTEPQGVLNASGTTDVTPGNPSTNTVTVNDLLDLLFGVNKEFRNRGGRQNAIYVMTDARYKTFRQLATGISNDNRLLLGEDVEEYRLFGHPVLIEENGLGDQHSVFFQPAGYRLYRRQGMRLISAQGGDTLTRQNTVLQGVDVRFGGQLDLGGYAAVIDGYATSA